MNTKSRLLASVALIAMLSGCANMNVKPVTSHTVEASNSSINGAYRTDDIDLGSQAVPTLQDLVNAVPTQGDTLPNTEDKLRGPAMRDAALSYGAQGGLAATSVEINKRLKAQAPELSKTYDFTRLIIKGPDGAMVLPPVISEAKDTWEAQDGGKSLRVADKFYEIIAQSRFTPNAPLWHTYLIRHFNLPSAPPDALLPKNDDERKFWAKYVRLGWTMGAKQARDIFQADLRRLERDFTGMVRYKQLEDEGKVSAPVIADANLGVTGNGSAMRVNDRSVQITQDPHLNTDTTKWDAPVSTVSPAEAATPPGKTFISPKPKQDVERLPAVKTEPVEMKVTYEAPAPKPSQAFIAPQDAPRNGISNAAIAPESPVAGASGNPNYF